MDNKSPTIIEMLSICAYTVVIIILKAWAGRAELHYSGKFQIQKLPALFWNLQVSSIAR